MAATPLPCCDRTTWEWGIRGPAQDVGRSPRVGNPHSHFAACRGAGARLSLGPQRPRRRDELGSGHAAGSAAPRCAAPCSAREPRARAPRTPRPARLVLPRPPAARGGGGARPAPRSSADAGGERARGVPSAPGGTAARGGAPRAALGPRSAVPTPTAVHCGAESRAAMNSAAERARGPPPGLSPPARRPARPPGRPAPTPQPRPTPDPARTALRRHILQLAAARARRERASSQPPRRARRRLPPRPRARPGPFSTRPALTCSLAQLQTLAVGSLSRQRASQDGMDAGARCVPL
ncbi:uncharacterized protein LOC116089503 [Mastomys coucha]|uniref:uncharacterized protein LOC116089503 n=1 Tax=Mastomys coucha TaxID=35658 RepID=UPI0012614063|nr:uncharacterized protein LOC116089503 [Mastomys coucha]